MRPQASLTSPSPSPTSSNPTAASSDAPRNGGGESRPTWSTNEEFLEVVITQHGDAIYRMAKSVVIDSALAEDVAQEAMIKAWQRSDSFRGDGSLRGWLLQITRNQAISTLRKIKDSATDPTLIPDAPEAIGPQRQVEGQVAVDAMGELLQHFDDLTRSILILREVEQMNYDEIAEILEVPLPTVRTRLMRGRRDLQRLMEDWR